MTSEVNEPSAKYLVGPDYKHTEVGFIPQEWAILTLGQIATIERGKFSARPRNDPKYYGGEFPFIQTGDVTRSGGSISTFTQTLNREGLRVSRLFPKGTLFFTIAANIGDVGIAMFEAACPDSLVAIVPNAGIQKGWLLYELARRKADFESLASPGAQLNINLEKLRPYSVPVPTTDEQRAIATALSDVDALIVGLERLIAKKRDIKQAAMQQLLTGRTRLPGFSGEWISKRLGDTAILKARIGWQGLTTAEYLSSGDHYLVTGTEFNHGYVDWGSCHFVDAARYKQDKHIQLRPRDVLVTTDGTIGKVALVPDLPGPATLNSGVFVIRPLNQSFIPEFFYYLLCSHFFADFLGQLAAGSTINHLYQKDFVSFVYRTPATNEEQTAIATVLSDMDADLSALESRLAKTRVIKQGMMQELLTGRTRLVDSVEQSHVQPSEPAEARKANVYFMRSVLAAEIVDQLHQEPTFGHVKFEKMMFLTEHLCQVDTGSQYARKAAGPLDRKALHSIDSQLRKQKWFDGRKENGRYRYVPLEKRGGHKDYFDRYFAPISAQLSSIIETFRTWDTERCEIVATLYAAWKDLLRENDAVSDDMIVHEVLHNWHESKQRIPEDRWLKALGWMRDKGYVPGRATGTTHD